MAFRVIEQDDIDLHRTSTVRSDYSFRMELEGVATYLLHDVVDEEVPVELLLQNEDLVPDQNAEVVLKPSYLEVL